MRENWAADERGKVHRISCGVGKENPYIKWGKGRVKDVLQVYNGRSVRAFPGDIKTVACSRSQGKASCKPFHY